MQSKWWNLFLTIKKFFIREQDVKDSQPKSEAEIKFIKYKSHDPFPDIQPALLNSADIHDYVNTTGMIDPFDENKLKSASYEAKIGGKCIFWENGEKVEQDIIPNTSFELKPNSIAFVEIEPIFRLPNYIALRFNLKITHVYRGLLLGTGPLIDPGYVGKIFIPLHNLTSNSYQFEYGEGLIWIEFTKISISSSWNNNTSEEVRSGRYKPFPENKTGKPLEYFLTKANKGLPVSSSIPDAIETTKKAAEDAKDQAIKAEEETKKFFTIGWISALAVVIAICSLVAIVVFNTFSINAGFQEKFELLNKVIVDQQTQIKSYESNDKKQAEQLGLFTDEIQRQQEQIQQLNSKMEKLVNQLGKKKNDMKK